MPIRKVFWGRMRVLEDARARGYTVPEAQPKNKYWREQKLPKILANLEDYAPKGPVQPKKAATPMTVKFPRGVRSASASIPTGIPGLEEALSSAAGGGAETHAAFEALRIKTLAFASEIMEMKLEPSDKNFAKLMSIKASIASSVMNTTSKVRPGDLRPRNEDGMDAFLAKLKSGDTVDPVAEDLFS